MSNNVEEMCESEIKYYVLVIGEDYPKDIKVVKVKFKRAWCHLAVLLDLVHKHSFRRIESYWIIREFNATLKIIECDWDGFIKMAQLILNGHDFMIVAERYEQDEDKEPDKEIWVFKVIKDQNIVKMIIELNKKDRKFSEAIIRDMMYYQIKKIEPEFVTNCDAFTGRKIRELPDVDWDFLFQNCINCKACSYPCNALK